MLIVELDIIFRNSINWAAVKGILLRSMIEDEV